MQGIRKNRSLVKEWGMWGDSVEQVEKIAGIGKDDKS